MIAMGNNGRTAAVEKALAIVKTFSPEERRTYYKYAPEVFEDYPADELIDQKSTSWADMANKIGPVHWSWKGWLPKGMLTILAAASGDGKSGLMLRIGGCFLRRDWWPDNTKCEIDPGVVLWVEAEAAQALNLSRAKEWGLPLERIYTPLSDPLVDIRLDIPEHQAAVAAKTMLPEVKLVVVDSLRGMHRGDENSSESMALVMWLASLARDSNKPIILSHHLRKRSLFDGDGVMLDRLRGSSAIVQTARVVWALDTPDPNNKDRKRLQVIKSNLAKFPDPIGMTISQGGIDFGAAPEPPRTETVLDRAIDLLKSLLHGEPQLATKIEGEFNSAGISIPTMKRAKEKLGIVSRKTQAGWYWSLPVRDVNNDSII